MGLNITEPFDTFWNGFPEEILTKIEEFSGRKVIREANKPYSGTAVIEDFGPRQMETGELIIYTLSRIQFFVNSLHTKDGLFL